MTVKTFSAALLMALALGACSQSDQSTQSAASSPAEAAPAMQELTSRDGKISLSLPNGAFADKLDDADFAASATDKAKLTLLQHDDAQEITLSAYATAANDAYLDKLAAALMADNSLSDAQAEKIDNRLHYRFSQLNADGESELNESCVATVQDKQAYTVCAASPTADVAELAAQLQHISIK